MDRHRHEPDQGAVLGGTWVGARVGRGRAIATRHRLLVVERGLAAVPGLVAHGTVRAPLSPTAGEVMPAERSAVAAR